MADEDQQGEPTVRSGTRRRLLTSALIKLATSVGGSALSLVNVVVVARVLGADGRGDLAFLTVVTLIASQVAIFGLNTALGTFSPREPEHTPSMLTNAVLLGAGFGLAAAGLIAALFALAPGTAPSVGWALRWAALLGIPVLIVQLCLSQLLVSHYRLATVNVGWLAGPVLNLGINGLLAATGALDVATAFLTWLGGQALICVFYAVVVLRQVVRPGRPDAAIARRMLRFGTKAQASSTLYSTNYRADQWILGGIAGDRELGVYSVAVAWSEVLFFLPTAVQYAQTPDLVRADPEQVAREMAAVHRVAWLATAVGAAGMVVLAPLLCEGVFGAEFADATSMLRLLAVGALGIATLKLLGNALTAQRRPLVEAAALAVTAALMLGLDLVLIPSLGGDGAAVASAVAYLAGGATVAVLFTRTLGGRVRDLVPTADDVRWIVRRLRGAVAAR